jgi:hypothetical protein
MLFSRFPEEIIQKYNLNALAVNGWIYIEIRKCMYGLKQTGLLAIQLLQTRLVPFVFYTAHRTPGLWLHKTRPISFTFVVENFTVKYVGKQHAEHLPNALLRTYELTTDWTATVYSGMNLKWDYKNRTCNISMPGYVSNVLSKFQHDAPKHPHHTPSRYVTPVYGANTQYATKDETPPLTAQQCLTIQKVTGSVLYYARAVDTTVLMPLNDIATEQSKATGKTQAATNHLLDYLATHPDATNPISRLRHDIAHQQRCLLPFSFKHTKPPRKSVLLRKKIPRTRHTKRINPQGRFRHQERGRLRSQIRSWSVLSQRPKWRPTQS